MSEFHGTSTQTPTDDQNGRNSSDDFEDLLGRKSKQKGPDPVQQLHHFLSYSTSQSADEILQWPHLKDIFVELNTPVPPSAASETLFSAASQIFLPRRSRINDSNFQNQLICKENSSFAWVNRNHTYKLVYKTCVSTLCKTIFYYVILTWADQWHMQTALTKNCWYYMKTFNKLCFTTLFSCL